MHHRRAILLRGCGLAVAAACSGSAACRLAVPPGTTLARALFVDGSGGLEALAFDDALSGVCAAVLLGCVLWLSLVATLALTAYVARELGPDSSWAGTLGRAVDRSCPATVVRLVAGALGVAVTVGVAGPALADPMPHPAPAVADRLSGLTLPDRPAGTVPHARSSVRPRPAAPHVVVRPGQSLWTIAAHLLPTAATDADITRAWHRLHRANESAVGADPDLILPGTRLVVPRPPAPPTREEAP